MATFFLLCWQTLIYHMITILLERLCNISFLYSTDTIWKIPTCKSLFRTLKKIIWAWDYFDFAIHICVPSLVKLFALKYKVPDFVHMFTQGPYLGGCCLDANKNIRTSCCSSNRFKRFKTRGSVPFFLDHFAFERSYHINVLIFVLRMDRSFSKSSNN